MIFAISWSHLEKCFARGVDFGILYSPKAVLPQDQINEITLKTKQLLLKIYKAFPLQSYNFIWSPRSNRHTGFASFNEITFKNQIEDYVKHQISFNVYEHIAASIKIELTELYRSFAKIKVLLVITQSPLDEETLKIFQMSFYGEKINLYNFVLDSSLVEKFEEPFSTKPRSGRLTYGIDDSDINGFIKIIKNFSQQTC